MKLLLLKFRKRVCYRKLFWIYKVRVMSRKSLVFEIAKTKTTKPFVASQHNFSAHFRVFQGFVIIKIMFFFSAHLISLSQMHGLKCFTFFFKIKHTELFSSCSGIFLLSHIINLASLNIFPRTPPGTGGWEGFIWGLTITVALTECVNLISFVMIRTYTVTFKICSTNQFSYLNVTR